MNPIAPNDKIQWLERQYAELTDELDALNSRLNLALNSFAKSTEPESAGAQRREPVATVVGPDSPIC